MASSFRETDSLESQVVAFRLPRLRQAVQLFHGVIAQGTRPRQETTYLRRQLLAWERGQVVALLAYGRPYTFSMASSLRETDKAGDDILERQNREHNLVA